MTRKSKPMERAKPKTTELPVSVKPDDEGRRKSIDPVLEQAETVRRLAHRAVDLIVDSGCHKLLSASAVDSLAFITWNEDVKNITDFVQRASAEQKEASDG